MRPNSEQIPNDAEYQRDFSEELRRGGEGMRQIAETRRKEAEQEGEARQDEYALEEACLAAESLRRR